MFRAIRVSIIPGSTIATRTPNAFISCAKTSLIASRADFEAAYGAMGATLILPATELTLTIVPWPRERMPGATA